MDEAQGTALSELKPGETGLVMGVTGDDALALRLRDLGFWPKTLVECVRRAPLGDPKQYLIRGYMLALRRDEAGRVLVQRGSN